MDARTCSWSFMSRLKGRPRFCGSCTISIGGTQRRREKRSLYSSKAGSGIFYICKFVFFFSFLILRATHIRTSLNLTTAFGVRKICSACSWTKKTSCLTARIESVSCSPAIGCSSIGWIFYWLRTALYNTH